MGRGPRLPDQGPSAKLQAGKSPRREHKPVRKSCKLQAPSFKRHEKDTIVKSKIISPKSNNDVPVEWRVRKKGNQYKVIDVLVAGVSMSVTQRSDFSSVIQRGGGDVSVLINHLKK